MHLKPILIDEDPGLALYANPDCQEIFKSYPDYYYKTGYAPPWTGYFVLREGQVVGACGFTGQPVNGQVEVAYGTFKQFEGQGIASFSCQALVNIARTTDPALVIMAKTAPEENASTKILKRNGFVFNGIVQDEGIGDAWEWILAP